MTNETPPDAGRLRVAFVIDSIGSDRAGTENQLLKIIEGLDQQFERHLICFTETPWLRENSARLKCQTHIVPVRSFKRLSTYCNFYKLIILLYTIRPHLVHTFFPIGNIMGVFAARFAGVRHIVSSRRDYGEWMRWDYLAMTRIANRFVSRFLTNSSSVKELTERVERVDGRRIEVILNGIDVTAVSLRDSEHVLKSELGIPQENRVVGIVANFRPMKHHETLVRGAQAILARRNDVDFVLIGANAGIDGTMKKVQALADSLGIAKRLHFVGSQTNVMRFLSIMDVGVNCSKAEGLSNAVIEYMLAGVPCVLSNSGGNPDLVTAGVHGALFELDDHAALAREVLRLLDDPECCEKYIANARQRVETEMSLSTMLRAHERFYRTLVDRTQYSGVGRRLPGPADPP